MCKLLDAQEFVAMYDHDIGKARADGAEQDFIDAETVIYQYQIECYDEAHGIS